MVAVSSVPVRSVDGVIVLEPTDSDSDALEVCDIVLDPRLCEVDLVSSTVSDWVGELRVCEIVNDTDRLKVRLASAVELPPVLVMLPVMVPLERLAVIVADDVELSVELPETVRDGAV